MGARELAADVWVTDADGVDQRFSAGTAEKDLPNGVASKITNPAAWGEDDPSEATFRPGGEAPLTADDAAGDGEDEVKPYAKWLKADLEAEVEKRNEGRDDEDHIVVGGTGKVSDLAEALEADDAAGDGDD